jgi:hypothetical protein
VLCFDGPESCLSTFLLASRFRSGASPFVWVHFAKAGGRAGSALGDLSGVGLLLLVSIWFQFAHGFIVLLCLTAAGVFHFTAPILVLVKTLFMMRRGKFVSFPAHRPCALTSFLAAVLIPVSIARFGPVVISALF